MNPIRTDLAVESASMLQHPLPSGVELFEKKIGDLTLTTVAIHSQEGARKIGRAPGRYITIELPDISSGIDPADDLTHLLADQLRELLPKEGSVLVIGLGNQQITPDALGPLTIRQIFATRHIPAQAARQTGLNDLRSVAALAPGVLGQTGIETGEIVHSITHALSPCAVIVVDALAAKSLSRLGNTIQLADAGISPGSGVLNARKELSEKTLGVPVISMGIPTVVDGSTLVRDLTKEQCCNEQSSHAQTMMVTPREIDAIIQRGAKHLSLAINAALQPQLSLEDITYLVS